MDNKEQIVRKEAEQILQSGKQEYSFPEMVTLIQWQYYNIKELYEYRSTLESEEIEQLNKVERQLIEMCDEFVGNLELMPNNLSWKERQEQESHVKLVHSVITKSQESIISNPNEHVKKRFLFKQMDYLNDAVEYISTAKVKSSTDDPMGKIRLTQVYSTTLCNLEKLKIELFGGTERAFPGGDPMAAMSAERGGQKLLNSQIKYFSAMVEDKKSGKNSFISIPSTNSNWSDELKMIDGILNSLKKFKEVKYS